MLGKGGNITQVAMKSGSFYDGEVKYVRSKLWPLLPSKDSGIVIPISGKISARNFTQRPKEVFPCASCRLKVHIPLDEPLFVQNMLVMSSGICKGKPGKDQNSSA